MNKTTIVLGNTSLHDVYCTVSDIVQCTHILIPQYSPQVYVNFKKKSTEAVAISVYLLDMGGGLTSLIQVRLDCVAVVY